MKDKFLNDGDPIKFEARQCVFLTCCECGLTHLLMLGDELGTQLLYVYRDDNLTAEARKEAKEKKTRLRKEKKAKKTLFDKTTFP